MYSVDNQEKSYVVTYRELLFAFIVFSAILIVLYPKDILKEQILAENSNYDLSMLYLKNLLEHDPANEELMLILAKQSLRSNKRDLSLRLLNLLLESKDIEIRNKAILLSYELQKEDYFYLDDESKKRELRKELQKLFSRIYYGNLYDAEDFEPWYEEAIFTDHRVALYDFTKRKLLKEPKNIALLESAFYIASQRKEAQSALKYIDALILYDPKRREKWLLDKYYMLLSLKRYETLEELLRYQANISQEWRERFASYYLLRKEYRRASSIYMELFQSQKSYRQKRGYFFKAVDSLQAGSLFKESAELAYSKENYYINDIEVRKYLLKLYMATGYLDYAVNLSRKILRKKMQ